MHTGTQSWFSQPPKRFPRTAFQNSAEGNEKSSKKLPRKLKIFGTQATKEWRSHCKVHRKSSFDLMEFFLMWKISKSKESTQVQFWHFRHFSFLSKEIVVLPSSFLVFLPSGDMDWCGDGAPYRGMTPLRSSSSCRPTWGRRAGEAKVHIEK